MTKKDYEAIAESIKQTTVIMNQTQVVNKAQLIYQLGRYFKSDNPRFNESKFVEACYYHEV